MFKNITFINALHGASFVSYIEIALLKKDRKSAFLQEYFFLVVFCENGRIGITSWHCGKMKLQETEF